MRSQLVRVDALQKQVRFLLTATPEKRPQSKCLWTGKAGVWPGHGLTVSAKNILTGQGIMPTLYSLVHFKKA